MIRQKLTWTKKKQCLRLSAIVARVWSMNSLAARCPYWESIHHLFNGKIDEADEHAYFFSIFFPVSRGYKSIVRACDTWSTRYYLSFEEEKKLKTLRYDFIYVLLFIFLCMLRLIMPCRLRCPLPFIFGAWVHAQLFHHHYGNDNE